MIKQFKNLLNILKTWTFFIHTLSLSSETFEINKEGGPNKAWEFADSQKNIYHVYSERKQEFSFTTCRQTARYLLSMPSILAKLSSMFSSMTIVLISEGNVLGLIQFFSKYILPAIWVYLLSNQG